MASILIIYNEIPNKKLNGGTIRVFYLLRELSHYHDITLLTIPASRVGKQNSTNGHLKFCKEVILAPRFAEQFLFVSPLEFFRFLWNNFYYIFLLYFSSKEKIVKEHYLQVYYLKRELKKILKQKSFDYVQVENAYLGEILSDLNGEFRRIVDFHDVYDWVDSLIPLCDIALSCCKKDSQRLKKIGYKKVLLVANGVDIKTAKPLLFPKKAKHLLFVGDLMYGPNKQGVYYFLREVYPFLDNFLPFHIIGRYKRSDFINEIKIPGVHFHGFLPMIDHYFDNAIFVCPVLEGRGTRIKILTAFLKGAPVVSTVKGAEGIESTDKKDIIIANSSEEFAKEISLLFEDVKRYNQMRLAGRNLVERAYDWNKIALFYAKNL